MKRGARFTVMKPVAAAFALMLTGSVLAQNPTQNFGLFPPTGKEAKPFRLSIRHADPYFVKAMLEGAAVNMPEWSTIPLAPPTAQGSPWLRGGRLIVNPTDNSLWWFPGTAPGGTGQGSGNQNQGGGPNQGGNDIG